MSSTVYRILILTLLLVFVINDVTSHKHRKQHDSKEESTSNEIKSTKKRFKKHFFKKGLFGHRHRGPHYGYHHGHGVVHWQKLGPPTHGIHPAPPMPDQCPHKCPDVVTCPTTTTMKPSIDKTKLQRCFDIGWTRHVYLSQSQIEIISAIFIISYSTFSEENLISILNKFEIDEKKMVSENVDIELIEVPAIQPGSIEACALNLEIKKELKSLNLTFNDLDQQRKRLEETLTTLRERNRICQMNRGESSEIDIEAPAFETPIGIRRGPDTSKQLRKRNFDDIVNTFNKKKSQVLNVQPQSSIVNTNLVNNITGVSTWKVLANMNITTISKHTIKLAIEQLKFELFSTCISKTTGIIENPKNVTLKTQEEILEPLMILFIKFIQLISSKREIDRNLGVKMNKCGSNNNVHLINSEIASYKLNIFEMHEKITILSSLIQMTTEEYTICVGTRNNFNF